MTRPHLTGETTRLVSFSGSVDPETDFLIRVRNREVAVDVADVDILTPVLSGRRGVAVRASMLIPSRVLPPPFPCKPRGCYELPRSGQ
jgi:hypothetical protein